MPKFVINNHAAISISTFMCLKLNVV